MLGFLYRFLGALWMLMGLAIGFITLAYVVLFDEISSLMMVELGPGEPFVSWLADRLGPGWLTWWGALLALFLVILGARLLMLSSSSRLTAMSFHLLAGIFLLILTIAVFVILNQDSFVFDLIPSGVDRTIILVGTLLSVGLIVVGFSMSTEQAWLTFSGSSGPVRVVGPDPWIRGSSTPQNGAYAKLVSLDDPEREPYFLKPGIHTTIGSQDNRTIVINESSVSKEHAHIEYDAGQFLLYDDGSTNGTYVNGQRLIGIPEALSSDDVVAFGRVEFRFEA